MTLGDGGALSFSRNGANDLQEMGVEVVVVVMACGA
jgi:hypothetical protein